VVFDVTSDGVMCTVLCAVWDHLCGRRPHVVMVKREPACTPMCTAHGTYTCNCFAALPLGLQVAHVWFHPHTASLWDLQTIIFDCCTLPTRSHEPASKLLGRSGIGMTRETAAMLEGRSLLGARFRTAVGLAR
jgi:hypothetical protein